MTYDSARTYTSKAAFTGLPNWWQKYGMTVSSAVGTLMYGIIGFFEDGRIDGPEWVAFSVLSANSVLIYVVPVFPGYGWIKNVINGVLAVLALGYQALTGVDTGGEILLLVWTFGTAAGVLLSPAVSPKTGGVSSGLGGVKV
jgi:hypothetical protein